MSGSVTDHDCVGELTVDHMFEYMKVLLSMIEYPTFCMWVSSYKLIVNKIISLERCTYIGS